ncbi:hypothetical protein SPAN111604_14090 [Sphingomonas antarctica]
MRLGKFAFAALCLLIVAPALAQSSHAVRGYTRRDGTYVAPHQQTNPNSTRLDNWSTRGNVNPYTGQIGTRDPNARSTNPYQPRSTTETDDSPDDGNQ